MSSESEVDETFAQTISTDAVEVKSPQKVFWGRYSGYFKDPVGHLWEFAHNPFTWIGPKDEVSEKKTMITVILMLSHFSKQCSR